MSESIRVKVTAHWMWKIYCVYQRICRLFGNYDPCLTTLGAHFNNGQMYISFVNRPAKGMPKVMNQMASGPEAMRESIALMQQTLDQYEAFHVK